MRKTRLLWQLYPSYLLITLASLLAVGWFATYSLQEIFSDTVRHNREQQLHVVDDLIGPRFDPREVERLQEICRNFGRTTGTRITLLDRQGNVLCDSEVHEPLENHATRPEVHEALSGEASSSTRFSSTLHQDMLYLAVPLLREGQVL